MVAHARHMKPVILMMGHTMPELAARRGDFHDWYAHQIGWSADRFHVVDVVGGEPLPDPHGVDGLIISGSAHSVVDEADWSVAAGQWASQVGRAGIPTLAICYGHQLLAHEMGGRVGLNPAGREIGVTEVTQCHPDPLFEGLPDTFPVIQTHMDAVLELPTGADPLATNALCTHQAYRLGDTLRAIQWHPEFDADVISHYIQVRSAMIDAEGGEGCAQRILSEVRDVASGRLILRNFVRHFLKAQPGD